MIQSYEAFIENLVQKNPQPDQNQLRKLLLRAYTEGWNRGSTQARQSAYDYPEQ